MLVTGPRAKLASVRARRAAPNGGDAADEIKGQHSGARVDSRGVFTQRAGGEALDASRWWC